MSVTMVLAVVAFILAVLSATGHAPLWTSVVILCLIELLRVLPK